MLRLFLVACLLLAPAAHAARPKLIHQSQIVSAPAGYEYFGYEVAIDGDWAIIAAATASPLAGQTQNHDALLYRRVNGRWTFDRLLVRRVHTGGSSNLVQFRSIAMSNGLAAIGTNPIQIFKRTDNSWAEIAHPFTAPPGDPDHVSGKLVWDGNTLLGERRECVEAERSWGAVIATVGADGTWSPLQRISGLDTYCELEALTWDISGNTVVVGTAPVDPEVGSPEMRIFRRSGTQWAMTAAVDSGGQAGVRGDEMFLIRGGAAGTRVYRNDDTLTLIDRLRKVGAGSGYDGGDEVHLRTAGDVVLVGRDVYRKDAAGKYQHVAILVNRGISWFHGAPEISGRTAISRAILEQGEGVLFHELPATYTPSPVIATGFNGTPPFTPLSGSFSVVATANGNRVYRQTSTAGEHRALLNSSDWQEQSIEADIRPGASFSSAGLAVRYLDDANFYAVQLRNNNVIELQRMRNGELSVLGQRTLANTGSPNRHVALKIRNYHLQVFVEGKEVIWQGDPRPIPHGSAALIGRGTVDYDNVVAAQVGQTYIFDLHNYGWCNGPLVWTDLYTRTGSGNWSCDYVVTDGEPANVMSQTSTADVARAIIGMTPTDDQVVSARVRMTAVNGRDRWIGFVTRYVNDSNYYYLTLRTNNTVSLRKLVNGVITELATTTLPVSMNTWYDVRLDAVGNELRAVINGVQVVQATDSSHPKGRNGMITNKAAAEYTGYLSWQP
jgi:hypothetical protein